MKSLQSYILRLARLVRRAYLRYVACWNDMKSRINLHLSRFNKLFDRLLALSGVEEQALLCQIQEGDRIQVLPASTYHSISANDYLKSLPRESRN